MLDRASLLKMLQFNLFRIIFVFFLSDLACVIGVDLLQFLGIWFKFKATTEESFNLIRTKPPFPSRNWDNHVDSIQSEMACKNLVQC